MNVTPRNPDLSANSARIELEYQVGRAVVDFETQTGFRVDGFRFLRVPQISTLPHALVSVDAQFTKGQP